jgi:hypothetical protein
VNRSGEIISGLRQDVNYILLKIYYLPRFSLLLVRTDNSRESFSAGQSSVHLPQALYRRQEGLL